MCWAPGFGVEVAPRVGAEQRQDRLQHRQAGRAGFAAGLLQPVAQLLVDQREQRDGRAPPRSPRWRGRAAPASAPGGRRARSTTRPGIGPRRPGSPRSASHPSSPRSGGGGNSAVPCGRPIPAEVRHRLTMVCGAPRASGRSGQGLTGSLVLEAPPRAVTPGVPAAGSRSSDGKPSRNPDRTRFSRPSAPVCGRNPRARPRPRAAVDKRGFAPQARSGGADPARALSTGGIAGTSPAPVTPRTGPNPCPIPRIGRRPGARAAAGLTRGLRARPRDMLCPPLDDANPAPQQTQQIQDSKGFLFGRSDPPIRAGRALALPPRARRRGWRRSLPSG